MISATAVASLPLSEALNRIERVCHAKFDAFQLVFWPDQNQWRMKVGRKLVMAASLSELLATGLAKDVLRIPETVTCTCPCSEDGTPGRYTGEEIVKGIPVFEPGFHGEDCPIHGRGSASCRSR